MTELCDIATKYGTDKAPWCWGYTATYAEWVPRDIRIVLEIGILGGASLRTWRDYFPQAQVYGIDNERSCMIKGEERITTLCFNAYDLTMLFPLFDEIGPIDFFVDDGAHHVPLQLAMFTVGWPFMRRGGVYAIEDIYDPNVDAVRDAVAGVPDVTDLTVVPAKQSYSMLIMRKA